MNYATLEEAHGAPFGKRAPITSAAAPPADDAIAKPEFTNINQRSQDSIKKNQSLIDSITKTLPLDQEPSTETFVTREQPQQRRMAARERFTERPVSSTDEDKLARILRLIEQNRTGYERPAVEDMLLYVFTGVFFLFTLDTFVQLGKTMRKVKA
jgi:hypothetical protein